MRFLVAAFVVVAITSPAVAKCIDYKKRACRLRGTFGSGELLRAPDFTELRAVMLRVGLSGGGENRTGWELESVRADMIDGVEVRGYGLGFRYQIERADWGAWLGVHLATVWTDSYRYFTPSLGFRIGAEDRTVATVELRSAGIYAGSVGGSPGRSFTRDFDLDARLSTPTSPSTRFALRSRLRDVDTGDVRFRDMFLAAGVELSIVHGSYRSNPSFVGIGMRRELARTRERPDDDVIERRLVSEEPAWQVLAWLDLNLGLEQR